MRHVRRFLLGLPFAGIGGLGIVAVVIVVREVGWKPIAWAFFGMCIVLIVYCVGGLVEVARDKRP